MSSATEDSSFPLYYHIVDGLKKADMYDKDITFEEIGEITSTVRTMDKNGLDCVFIIVRIHSLRNEDVKVFDVPYKGEKITKSAPESDIKFDIRVFPPELRRILLEFVRMYNNRKNESIN
jgi:hypothetical protein